MRRVSFPIPTTLLATSVLTALVMWSAPARAADVVMVKPFVIYQYPDGGRWLFEKVTVTVGGGGTYLDGIKYNCTQPQTGGSQYHEYGIQPMYGAFTLNFEDPQAFLLQSGTSTLWAVATGKTDPYRYIPQDEWPRWYASTGGGSDDQVTVP